MTNSYLTGFQLSGFFSKNDVFNKVNNALFKDELLSNSNKASRNTKDCVTKEYNLELNNIYLYFAVVVDLKFHLSSNLVLLKLVHSLVSNESFFLISKSKYYIY